MKHQTVRLPESLVERVDVFARQQTTARGEAMRRLLERGLAGYALDGLDLSRTLADMQLTLREVDGRLASLDSRSDDVGAVLQELREASNPLLQGLGQLQDSTESALSRQEEIMAMAATIEVVSRIFLKAKFPAEFKQLDQLAEQQLMLVEEAVEAQAGRIVDRDRKNEGKKK